MQTWRLQRLQLWQRSWTSGQPRNDCQGQNTISRLGVSMDSSDLQRAGARYRSSTEKRQFDPRDDFLPWSIRVRDCSSRHPKNIKSLDEKPSLNLAVLHSLRKLQYSSYPVLPIKNNSKIFTSTTAVLKSLQLF